MTLPAQRETGLCWLKATEGVYWDIEASLLGQWQRLVVVKKILVTALHL